MIVRLYCLADTHGIPPGPCNESLCDAWLLAGDILDKGQISHEMTTWLSNRQRPVYAVMGNHDCGPCSDMIASHCDDVSGRAVEIAPGLLLAGIGWSGVSFFDLPTEADLARVASSVTRSLGYQLRDGVQVILLSHYPVDGSGALRAIVDGFDVIAVVEGHLEARACQQWRIGSTLAVNPGPGGGLLEVDVDTGNVGFEPWLPL